MIDTLYYITRTDNTNNHKLHKFATTKIDFEKVDYFRHASSYNIQVYQFSAKSS